MLGDSLTKYGYEAINDRLRSDGWLPTIICWGGMQTGWGTAQARDVAKRRYIPERVVIGFGTNDVHKNPCYSASACAKQAQVFGREVNTLLDYLGPDRKVWWLNIDMDANRAAQFLDEPWNIHFGLFNAELAEVVARHSNVTLVDWREIVSDARQRNPIPMTEDGLHYAPLTPATESRGTMLRVSTIANELRRAG